MTISYRRRYLLCILVLWLAFGLRLYRLDFQSIWWDEGHSIFVASQPVSRIPTLPAMDVHPPAYFALLHMWMELAGRSEFALRYLSTIFSLLTVALLWRFAAVMVESIPPIRINRSYFGRLKNKFPLFTALLAALSPMYVAYGQEVRSYAMITFLALASTFSLWRLLFGDARLGSPKKRLILLLSYISLTTACLYTHYFTVFLLLFQNLVWLAWSLAPLKAHFDLNKSSVVTKNVSHSDHRAKCWLASQAGILLLFSPQLLLAWQQATRYTNSNLIPPSLAHFVERSWQAYTVGLTLDPGLARWGMGLIAIILGSGWLVQIAVTRARRPSRLPGLIFFFIFLSLWLLIPLSSYFIILQRQPSFEPRYMMLITPALFLLLALSLSWESDGCAQTTNVSCATRYARRATWSAIHILANLAALIIFCIGLYNYYTNETYFKDDSAGVVEWLAAETTPDDIVYLDTPHPFHYYAEQREIPAPMRYLFVNIHTAAETLNQEAADRDRLFWVTWRGSDTDPRGVIPFLAEKAGRQFGQRDFQGYRVTQFDLPDTKPVTFSLPNSLRPMQATFGDVLRLDGAAFGGQQGQATTTHEPIWATLHFNLLRESDINYKVSLRLRTKDGRGAAQVDRDLLNDRHVRTSAWPLDDPALNQATNVYTLPLPPDIPPGTYRLEVVVYNATPPYPSEGVTGRDTEDGVAAVLGYIVVVP
jgi:uncharacterized membrane protein